MKQENKRFPKDVFDINTTAYHLGRYEPSSPSTKELSGRNHILN